MSSLMDWIEKIRIGVWLAYCTLEGHERGAEPRYHIDSRLGRKDNLIAIGRTTDDGEMLKFFPFCDPLFSHIPCFFLLQVNWISIINVSTDWLVARAYGLPYYSPTRYYKNGRADYTLHEADPNTTCFHEFGPKYKVLIRSKYYDPLDLKKLKCGDKAALFESNINQTKPIIIAGQKLCPYVKQGPRSWIPRHTPSMKHLLTNSYRTVLSIRKKLHSNFSKNPAMRDVPSFASDMDEYSRMFDNFTGFR